MDKIDLSPLVSTDNVYNTAANLVTEKYKAAWDDAVHDSFRKFVAQVKDNGHRLHCVRTSVELIKKAVVALNVQEANLKAQRLTKEAESL